MNKKFKNIVIAISALFIFGTSNVNAGILLSQEEMYGNNRDGGGHESTFIIILIVIFFLAYAINFIFKKIEASEIEKDNIQKFKKILDGLPGNAKNQDLAKKVQDYRRLFLNADMQYRFGNLSAAEDKEKEINNKAIGLAFIHKSQSKDGYGYDYVVLEFKK